MPEIPGVSKEIEKARKYGALQYMHLNIKHYKRPEMNKSIEIFWAYEKPQPSVCCFIRNYTIFISIIFFFFAPNASTPRALSQFSASLLNFLACLCLYLMTRIHYRFNSIRSSPGKRSDTKQHFENSCTHLLLLLSQKMSAHFCIQRMQLVLFM